MPSTYIPALNQHVQSGPRTVSFTLTFYTDSGLPALLAKSLLINGDINDPPNPSNKYVVLCINANSTKKSFLFNEISTQVSYDPNYDKSNPVTIRVNFTAENLDPEYDLYQEGTPAELALILGPRSPI